MMSRMVTGSLVIGMLCAHTLFACGDEKTVTSIENDGALCVSPTADGIDVKVLFDTCISPGCDQKESASCTAALTDGKIQITSHATVARVEDAKRDCAAVCVAPAATCGLGVARAGTYEVIHGVLVGTITLPLPESVGLGADNACQLATE